MPILEVNQFIDLFQVKVMLFCVLCFRIIPESHKVSHLSFWNMGLPPILTGPKLETVCLISKLVMDIFVPLW